MYWRWSSERPTALEVPTEVSKMIKTFWDVTPCSLTFIDFSEDHFASLFNTEDAYLPIYKTSLPKNPQSYD
jgi:hypothetical protein